MSRKKAPPAASLGLTERALADIREIERYSTQRWGRATADKYVASISAALDQLSENPQLLQREPAFSTGLYFYRVQKHILVCDLRDKCIVVLTVIHASMDIPTRLAELEPRLAAEIEFLHHKLAGSSKTD